VPAPPPAPLLPDAAIWAAWLDPAGWLRRLRPRPSGDRDA